MQPVAHSQRSLSSDESTPGLVLVSRRGRSAGPRHHEFDRLCTQADRLVESRFVDGRSVQMRRVERLLGRVGAARLELARRGRGGDAADRALAVAESGLHSLSRTWEGRASRRLEWIIIGLIAADIVIHLLWP